MLDTLKSLRERLAPHYDVERQIGAGGMARVYLAVQQHPHRRVAIKVIDPELSNRLLRERFIREVDLSSKLSHPHIVPIFSAGEVDGLFYYVMPYVEGESLRHRLLRERKLPLEAALHITRDVADALAFAHAQGIIHRDIKPENILLSGHHAIVAVLGIARAISAAGALTIQQTGQSLGGSAHRTSVPTRGIFAGRRGRRIALVGAALVVAGAAAGAFLALRRPVSGLKDRRVVVAVIENHTGDPAFDNLGHMAADWVTQGLAQTGLVEVVPSMSVMTASLPSGGHGSAHLDAAGLRALGRETGAGTVVWGSYYRQGDSVRFQVQISAANDGTVLRALDPVAGPLAQPLDAVEALRQRVMAALATLFDSRLSRWATTASQPPNFQAYQEFIAGLDRFVQFDMRGAIAHFERASAVDTAFRLPLIFAANAHMNVGEFAAADAIGHALERHSGRLAPLDRAYLAWVLATCRGDRAEALRASRAMASLAPASETLYLVAEDARALNRPREAVDALVALGPDRGFTRGWWVYWDELTTALHLLGDHRAELKQALEGARRFPDNPQVLMTQVRALAALGRADEVMQRLAASVNLPAMQRWTPADGMVVAALELRAHVLAVAGDAELVLARDGLAGRSAAEAASEEHRLRVALVSYIAGRLADAQRQFPLLAAPDRLGRSESLGAAGAAAVTGDGWDQLDYVGYLGVIAARQGNREPALRVDRTLADLKRPYSFGRHTVWRARIQALLGERDVAVGLLREAIAQGYPHAHALHTDLAFDSLRNYPPFVELLKPKE